MGMGMGWGRMRYQEEQLPKPRITKYLLMRAVSYFSPYWLFLFFVLMTILAAALLGLIPPLLIKDIIDKALPNKDMYLLALLTIASLGATILTGLMGVLENYLSTWISSHIIQDIKNAMFKHLEYMSLQFFSRIKSGDIITRMTSDIGGIRDVFKTTIVNFVRSVFVLSATAIALVSMNWKLALLGMFIVPFFALPTKKVGKVRWKIASQSQEKLEVLNQIIQDTLTISGAALMKIFNREKLEYQKFEDVNKEVTQLQIKESVAGRWFRMAVSIFTTIGPMFIYFYGGYLFIKGEISIGGIVAFVAMLTRLYAPVVQLSNIHIELTRSLALFERIFEYFDMTHDIKDSPSAKVIQSFKGAVEFRDVSFSYTKSTPVLKHISFVARPGTMTALVGPSGAGKSTITNLIPRLYDTTEGSIEIDGIDIRDITIDSLRAHMGMVMQDIYLFNDTIRENLLYAKSDAT
ncbi:MAG: ABC transporter ATP-binding protein, partial [Spirochaetales bacterium]|nr:ABC transporter ATP-binding protein [Spirochaetales bacterium]